MTSHPPVACMHRLHSAACCRFAVAILLVMVHLLAVGNRVHAQADATVSITSPGEGQTVAGDLQVRGTVQGAGLQSYALYWRAAGDDREIYFSGGQEEVNASVLGVWRAGDNPPGEYEMRLEAQFEGRDPTETIVRFTLADAAETTGQEPETAATIPTEDQTLRQSLDQLAARARPAALAAYLARGMRFGLTVALIVLAYFSVKTVAVWLLGSRKP